MTYTNRRHVYERHGVARMSAWRAGFVLSAADGELAPKGLRFTQPRATPWGGAARRPGVGPTGQPFPGADAANCWPVGPTTVIMNLPTTQGVALGWEKQGPSAPSPQSPANAVAGRCPASPHPRAFTLIELLIVISIMMILMGLVATMAPLDREGRRVREAARSINGYLSSARNRAIETGRPCGVIFRNFNGTGAAMNADQCEVPPSFCGETELSYARVHVDASKTHVIVELFDNGSDFYLISGHNMVRPGDLIQFNHQGPLYTIHYDATGPTPYNVVDTNGFIVTDASLPNIYVSVASSSQNTLVPWGTSYSGYIPYRIFRAPIKGYAPPLQMPVPTVVDLTASGIGTVFPGAADFTVLFSPTGAVECVYYNYSRATAGGTIYLLIGSNERVANPYVDSNTNVDTLTNYQDMNNIWVTINPQTGAVQTEPVGTCAGVTDPDDAKIAARALAVEGIGMGGK